MAVQGEWPLIRRVSSPRSPLSPSKKAKDDVEALEQIASKHPTSFSTGMNRMNGDEEDKSNEINTKQKMLKRGGRGEKPLGIVRTVLS